jgi:hypothetical protein
MMKKLSVVVITMEGKEGDGPLPIHSLGGGGRGTIPPSLARGSRPFSPPLPGEHRGAAGPLICTLLFAFYTDILQVRRKLYVKIQMIFENVNWKLRD